MIKLNVGCNFDRDLIDGFTKFNNMYRKNGVQITELYGSLQKGIADLPTARPDFRIPHQSIESMKEFIEFCHQHEFKFNYTLNSSLTSEWFNKDKEDYKNIIDILENLGVDIVTIAHHLPLRYISNKFDIEISTILEVNTINAIAYYLDNFSVKKICISQAKNRNFAFLSAISENRMNNEVELLANEFCCFGGNFCQSFTRKSCYEMHGLGGNKELKHGGFPLLWCSASRYRSPSSFLKAPVIYPWDLKYYRDNFGIRHFKLSGRTLPTEYILKTVESYMSLVEVMDKNVLALWGHVDRVGKGDLMKIPAIFIDKDKLRKENFVTSMFIKKVDCETALCENCKYCEKIYKRVKGKDNGPRKIE